MAYSSPRPARYLPGDWQVDALHAHRGFFSGHEPYTRLPLFCRIRITPGNHRKHRPEAHRRNRPGDFVDGYLSGPDCTRTRPPGASVNRRYGHHGDARTDSRAVRVSPLPGSGPGMGYHQHGLYRASAHTGAGRHTAAPAVQQQHLSSAPSAGWLSSTPTTVYFDSAV